MLRTSRVLLLLVGCLLLPVRSEAWGFEAHKFIMARAIAMLPAQIRPFFEAVRPAIVERSVDPDLWRTAGWEDEPPRHFVDLDAYEPFPFAGVPREFDAAVAARGRDFVIKNGFDLLGRRIPLQLAVPLRQLMRSISSRRV